MLINLSTAVFFINVLTILQYTDASPCKFRCYLYKQCESILLTCSDKRNGSALLNLSCSIENERILVVNYENDFNLMAADFIDPELVKFLTAKQSQITALIIYAHVQAVTLESLQPPGLDNNQSFYINLYKTKILDVYGTLAIGYSRALSFFASAYLPVGKTPESLDYFPQLSICKSGCGKSLKGCIKKTYINNRVIDSVKSEKIAPHLPKYFTVYQGTSDLCPKQCRCSPVNLFKNDCLGYFPICQYKANELDDALNQTGPNQYDFCNKPDALKNSSTSSLKIGAGKWFWMLLAMVLSYPMRKMLLH